MWTLSEKAVEVNHGPLLERFICGVWRAMEATLTVLKAWLVACEAEGQRQETGDNIHEDRLILRLELEGSTQSVTEKELLFRLVF